MMLGGTGGSSSNGRWSFTTQFMRIEPGDRVERGIEAWRRAVTATLIDLKYKERGRYGGRCAAGWIRCPEARDALRSSKDDAARLMAGDDVAVAEPQDSDWVWRARAVHRHYPALRERMRPLIEAHAARYPPGGDGSWERVIPAAWLGGFSLLLVAVALRSKPNVAASASALGAAVLFSFVKLQFEWVDVTELLALPLLAYGSVALARAVHPVSRAVWMGAVVSTALVILQVWVILGAPALAARLGDLAYIALPAVLLLTTDPLVGEVGGMTPGRAFRWYAITALLPALSMALLELANWVTRRPAQMQVGTVGECGLTVLAIAGLLSAGMGFRSLRKRMRALRDQA